jgi:hypothetical protein
VTANPTNGPMKTIAAMASWAVTCSTVMTVSSPFQSTSGFKLPKSLTVDR